MRTARFHYVVGETQAARAAFENFTRTHPHTPPAEATHVVVLGGDGTMLEALHAFSTLPLPLYGLNLGTVGFLMNPFTADNLPARVAAALPITLHPLRMHARTLSGSTIDAMAFNEVALFRQTRQSAHIQIAIDDVVRLEELVCDGALVATPAGSTAYNLSAHGPIVPLTQPMLALTPISPFRPRRWRGALLPNTARISFTVRDADKRPVGATADFTEARDVRSVTVWEDLQTSVRVLFDPGNGLQERILFEQFHG